MPNSIRDIATRDDTSFPYIFEQNVSIPLKDQSGLIRCNVYRPKELQHAPVIVTYGPYGKDIPYRECVLPFRVALLVLTRYLASTPNHSTRSIPNNVLNIPHGKPLIPLSGQGTAMRSCAQMKEVPASHQAN